MTDMNETNKKSDPYARVIEFFNQDDTAGSFLAEDGEGGLVGAMYRMAREIDSLRIARVSGAVPEHRHMPALEVRLVSLSLAGDEDLPNEPSVVLCGDIDAVKLAAKLFGQKVVLEVAL